VRESGRQRDIRQKTEKQGETKGQDRGEEIEREKRAGGGQNRRDRREFYEELYAIKKDS
jgi:hypothetical protein